jgi:hypothetical protein
MDLDARWAEVWLGPEGDCPYPVTIVRDRYTGSYAGALWLAYPLHNWPAESQSGDIDARDFWQRADEIDHPIGKGSTPDEALATLVDGMKALAEKGGP